MSEVPKKNKGGDHICFQSVMCVMMSWNKT